MPHDATLPDAPVLAARRYVSATRSTTPLTGLDAETRAVALGLKAGDPAAVLTVAQALAPLVLPILRTSGGALLVAAPASTGDPSPNVHLADALRRTLIASPDGATLSLGVSDAVTRHTPVASSWQRRQQGLAGLTAIDHRASMQARPLTAAERAAATRGVLVIDNVWTSGATARATAETLIAVSPTPCGTLPILAAVWARTGVPRLPTPPAPAPAALPTHAAASPITTL